MKTQLLQRAVAVFASVAITYGLFSAVVSLAVHTPGAQVAERDDGLGCDRVVAMAQPR